VLFEKLKADIATHIHIDDAESHLNLAIAYSEMGLNADAVLEAATALRADIEGPNARQALQMLLTRPLMLPEGMKKLRDRLRDRRTLH
jgi:hypothetical protein